LALEIISKPDMIRSSQMTSYYWKELAMLYVDDRPEEIAAAVIGEHGNPTGEVWFADYGLAREVIQACVEKRPDSVWRLLETRLSSKAGACAFSIGFPRGVVDRVPPEQVLSWVHSDPDMRASIVARLVSISFARDDTLAARIVGAYGDREDVASACFSEYVSGAWWGPASSHWEQLATSIEEVAKRTNLPKLRRWASDAASSLRQMAERDRKREEEELLRER
jgi:hypothetical protein